ncbi:membrane protein [Erwinia typographi]|uniref:Membrane protein n=1 Tax=Erwinia typographi TaxID=371042 RepID=A0A0A3Z8C7_9GAMM|nr:DUF943 family protein [Erwinia typographi]KGT95100.1 membrane protein [Erwinia typographi]
MKKLPIVFAALVIIVTGSYLYLNRRDVRVIAAHHGEYTAQILVDRLPLSKSDSIAWWIENKSEILSKYHIVPDEDGGPKFITIFAFGKGYQEPSQEDRLCFEDVTPPKNCIDKDILMAVHVTRNGDTKFSFKYSSYLLTKEGKITKSKSD